MQPQPSIGINQMDHPPRLDLPVFIRYRKRRFQGASLRALSQDEIEVRVQALTLPPGTSVELEFLHSGRQWRLPAQVARGSSGDIGLRLKDPLPELLHKAPQLP
ncbi:hypothetical protein Thiowin_03039 [Thiorhodovibrio winogradskyi]|uniref:PilZ domain-containing protein n=1 Tax=Thiorhodovibrio winogradskyi TaxID=77007 RepID=A0ABZ0SAE3_9GAMM|nr:PilZ domain-containing protein [Thiorhodovibrio winogradskyi]